MRVAMHLGTLRGQGSGRVGRNVLRAMAAVAPDVRFLAWVPGEWRTGTDPRLTSLPDSVELRFTTRGIHRKILDENVFIRWALTDWGADVLFSLGDTSLPLAPVPHVLLVQQAHLVYARGERRFSLPVSQEMRWVAMGLYLRACLPTVDRLTVQTHDMKSRLCSRFGVAKETVEVIPSAVDVPKDAPERRSPQDGKYVCYVSSAGPHKNHLVLVPMMEALRHENPGLRCSLTVGRNELPELWREAAGRGLTECFRFEGTVPRDRAMQLMRDAGVVVIPSKLESFGFPYYEAMGLGVPIVAADRPFAREACGEAALYADADDGGAFAHAVARILNSEELANHLRNAARQRFETTSRSWADVARDYLSLLERAAREPGLRAP